MSAASRPARIYATGLVGLLVGGTIMSLVLTAFSAGRSDLKENRRLAAFPGMPRSIAQWQAVPGRFEAFVDDHFGFRKPLLRLNNQVSASLLNKPLTKNVIQGSDGWLFFAGDNSLELYRNERPLSPNELADWRDELTRRTAWLASRNIHYVFAIPPDKHTIYPEFMPAYYWRRNQPSQYDQIVSRAKDAGLPVADLRPALMKAKAGGLLYLKQDTHWNEWGAYIGYRAIMTAVTAMLDVAVLDQHRADLPISDTGTGDLARMAGLNGTETAPEADQSTYQCRVKTVDEPVSESHPIAIERLSCPDRSYKALIFRDSFMESMVGYFGQTFGESVLVWKEPSFSEFKAYVEAEKPDIVIEERVERFLQLAPEHVSD